MSASGPRGVLASGSGGVSTSGPEGLSVSGPRETPPGRHSPRQTIPLGRPTRWPLQRTIRILLECILVYMHETAKVSAEGHNHPPEGAILPPE